MDAPEGHAVVAAARHGVGATARHGVGATARHGVIPAAEYGIGAAINPLGATTDQTITASLRLLCYGAAADQVVKYTRISEALIHRSFKYFVHAVVDEFSLNGYVFQTRLIVMPLWSNIQHYDFQIASGASMWRVGRGQTTPWRGRGDTLEKNKSQVLGLKSSVTIVITFGQSSAAVLGRVTTLQSCRHRRCSGT
jgi:hypothetical protein